MGKLLDLIILDTRNYDRSITSLGMWLLNSFCAWRLTSRKDGMMNTLVSSITTQVVASWGRARRTGSTVH
jgi:hypothetical protein